MGRFVFHNMGKMPTGFAKKAFYYSIDAFLAIVIITVGILVALQSGRSVQPKQQVLVYAEDITTYLAQTRIYDLNDDLYPTSLKVWKANGSIDYPDNTLLEQAGEFYAIGQNQMAEYLLSNVTIVSLDDKFNLQVLVEKQPLFTYGTVNPNSSKSLVTKRVIITGLMSEKETWGPYLAEIRVWQ